MLDAPANLGPEEQTLTTPASYIEIADPSYNEGIKVNFLQEIIDVLTFSKKTSAPKDHIIPILEHLKSYDTFEKQGPDSKLRPSFVGTQALVEHSLKFYSDISYFITSL